LLDVAVTEHVPTVPARRRDVQGAVGGMHKRCAACGALDIAVLKAKLKNKCDGNRRKKPKQKERKTPSRIVMRARRAGVLDENNYAEVGRNKPVRERSENAEALGTRCGLGIEATCHATSNVAVERPPANVSRMRLYRSRPAPTPC
jgi:hypothetical protein